MITAPRVGLQILGRTNITEVPVFLYIFISPAAAKNNKVSK